MPGVSGTVTADDVTYQYAEESFGTNRGIKMTAATEGVQGTITYKFKPNPHDDRWYNKNQSKFYEQAATEIAQLTTVAKGNATFPAYDTQIEVHKTDYTLEQR